MKRFLPLLKSFHFGIASYVNDMNFTIVNWREHTGMAF